MDIRSEWIVVTWHLLISRRLELSPGICFSFEDFKIIGVQQTAEKPLA